MKTLEYNSKRLAKRIQALMKERIVKRHRFTEHFKERTENARNR